MPAHAENGSHVVLRCGVEDLAGYVCRRFAGDAGAPEDSARERFMQISSRELRITDVENDIRRLIVENDIQQSSTKAHQRGNAARASSSRHSREVLQMRQTASNAAEKLTANKKRHRNRVTI